MPRINVYVPDAMKERMDRLADQINWSEAAQAAFAREIANLTFKGDNMEQVIERLRASKIDFERSEHEKGRKYGHEWACEQATYYQLKAVSELDPDSDAKDVAAALDRAIGNNPREGKSLWMNEDTGRVRYPTDLYAYGFWDAADDVFAEVQQKLEQP